MSDRPPSKRATVVGVLLLFAYPAFVIAYDVWLEGTHRETISEYTLALCQDYPAAMGAWVFMVGGLFFHLLFPQIRYRQEDAMPRTLVGAVRPAQPGEHDAVAAIASARFSPGGKILGEILARVDGSLASVYVLAYSFTSKPIAEALVRAKSRGVDVRVVLDRSQLGPHSMAETLRAGGVPVLIDSAHAIAHNKVIVVDRLDVIAGSYNFTDAAELHNAENCLFIESEPLAGLYADEWRRHAGHSTPYAGRPLTATTAAPGEEDDPEADQGA